MKKIILALLMLCLMPALPALAQPASPKPESYQARPYIPPTAEPAIRSGAASRKRSVPASPAGRDYAPGSKSKARDRARTQSTWRAEQRKISERSRPSVPQPPLKPGNPNIMGTPAPGQPTFPSNNR